MRKNWQSLEDEALLRLILDHQDQEAEEVLYERYAPKVYRKCFNILRDSEEAKDLQQDIMLRVLDRLHQYKGNSKFSYWVFAITYNYCMNWLKEQKRWPKEALTALHDYAEEETEVLEQLEKRELELDQLEKLMASLKAEERMLLEMHYFNKMSVKEIAIVLNLGESAVKMRMKRARAKLANQLKR
jgi:RNA polymerase sigma factor (sigma-70 family)